MAKTLVLSDDANTQVDMGAMTSAYQEIDSRSDSSGIQSQDTPLGRVPEVGRLPEDSDVQIHSTRSGQQAAACSSNRLNTQPAAIVHCWASYIGTAVFTAGQTAQVQHCSLLGKLDR